MQVLYDKALAYCPEQICIMFDIDSEEMLVWNDPVSQEWWRLPF
jgi:hypothetical protein